MKGSFEKTCSVPAIFLEVIKVDPTVFILQYVVSIVSSVLMGLFIAQLQEVFDHAAALAASPSQNTIQVLLIALMILFLFKYGSEGLQILNGYLGHVYYNRCALHFMKLYNQRVSKAAAFTFEDERDLALYRKALDGALESRGMLHVIMDVFTVYLPYFATVAVYLANQDASLLILFPLVAAPVLITNQMKKRINAKVCEDAILPQRKKEEYARYLSDPAYFRVHSATP